MSKAGKRPLRTLTAQEKLAAVKRVSAGGESKASVARDIGVPESTLRGWCKNYQKIYNQACASPNKVDELEGIDAKRTKLDEPYDLSLRDTSESSCSPTSPSDAEQAKEEPEPGPSPMNMCMVGASTSSKATTPVPSATKERLKNRAELARLSAELGLNRPEVFQNPLPANRCSLSETLLLWNTLYSQLLYQRKLMNPQQAHQQNKYPDLAEATSKLTNGCSETKRETFLPGTDRLPSFQESVSYWLQQQTAMGLNAATSSTMPTQVNQSAALPVATTTTVPLPTEPAVANISNHNGFPMNTLPTSSTVSPVRYSSCTKQSTSVANQSQPPQSTSDKQILYTQLTKETIVRDNQNSENAAVKEEKPKNNNKNRSVLDNIYINNRIESNGNSSSATEKQPLDRNEAMQHGEIFLNWLESCSDPAVTAIQISSLQTLIKNLKNGHCRKNGESQNGKIRRRK